MKALVQNHLRAFALLFFFGCAATVRGQLAARFTASPVAGCSPLVVYFNDSSSGDPTKWKWDLGNGAVSFLRNPSATYFNPGTYTVKLLVSNASGADSVVKSELITVYAAPVPAFGNNMASGCFPLPVQFTDSSMAGSGTIASWQWDFGDGTISPEKNPAHTYKSAGNFTVTLRVINSFGCSKTVSQSSTVQIANGVTAAFSNTNPGICQLPASVQFTNGSTGPGPLSYQWQFGDGTTSTDANPTHVYTQDGDYTVTLVATSPQGCVDTISKPRLLKIGAAKAGFTLPSNICAGQKINFTNASTPAPQSVKWEFGDGSSSTQMNPIKTYTAAGTYTVRLIANFGSCSDTTENTVVVASLPKADISAITQATCRLPYDVQFKSLQTGDGFQYKWDFGDSTTGEGAEPLHAYTKEGSYTVKLVVINANGCTDTVTKKAFVTIQKPQLQVSGLSRTGCVPKSVKPVAGYTTGQTISSYFWDFGDGYTSMDPSPEHNYTMPGTYTVRLIVTTTEGCTDTLTMGGAVRLGLKPTAAFENQPAVTCPFEKVFFTDKSTGDADQWFWDFGDGGTSKLQNPFHQYSDTGFIKVVLVAYNNTCPDTAIVKQAVYVNPPVAIFSVKNDCSEKYTKTFVDRSLGPKNWFWDFGDGTTSTEQHPVHTYAQPGRYNVKLTVSNGNCSHFSVRTVAVIDESANFIPSDSVICRNTTAQFDIKGITASNIQSWQWTYGDGVVSNDVTKNKYTYTKTGTYNVSLTVTDLLGCSSFKSVLVTVYGPTAKFTPSVNAACLPGNVIGFTDASVTDGEHPIRTWTWNYGDKLIDTLTEGPFQHSYQETGSYTVKLIVKDENGCTDSSTYATPVVITQPRAAFSISDSVMCTGKNIRFTNASSGVNPVYQWSFGDGATSTLANPVYAYKATGIYTSKLVVTDKNGCRDSLMSATDIAISYPKAAFALSDTFGTCPPLLVHFTNQSTDYKNITWDFGDNNGSKLDTPSHFYATPGIFYATLVATGPGGCTDTARQRIEVKGPSGTFSYEPLTGCKPLTVHFKASNKNNVSFIWDFSDGATVSSVKDTISHTYIAAGDFVPKMILTDAAGCSVPVQGKDTIRVKDATADFLMSKSVLCDEGTVQFTNQTISNDFITAYRWNFGDGQVSTATNPVHHYAKPGIYSVQLTTTTLSGCSDTRLLTDTVKVYESPVVQIVGDSAACASSSFQFSGKVIRGQASLLKWDWALGNGETATAQNPAAQRYSKAGDYTIAAIATNNYGCGDTAFRKAVVYPMPTTSVGPDQWICSGNFLQLKATGAEKYQWNAASSLSCTNCDAPLAAPADTTQYVVTGFTNYGCQVSDTITVGVHHPFELRVGKGDTICAGKSVVLSATGAANYSWYPSAGVKNATAGVTSATPSVTTEYRVIAKDNVGCFADTGMVYVKVWPIPTVMAETAQTMTVGNAIRLQPVYSSDVISYQWGNAQTLSCTTCPNPVARPKTETEYTVEVKNGGGCTARQGITVQVICNDGNFFIPNTFSPNTDGRNDRFYPRGTGISSIKSLKVYNRWGEMVFSRENFNANDAAAGWDGMYKGKFVSSDVYVYTCEVVCMNHEVLTYRGDLTLLR